MRQKQKNNFSLRLKVVGGALTSDQLRTIADAADKFGRQGVHLTSRQGLEIPFVKLKQTEEIKEFLTQNGVSPGVCGPRVRTVTACQGEKICPSGCIDTFSLAKAISDRYFGRQLPHKFKFGVTGCQNNCLKAEENDLGIKGGYEIEYSSDNCSFCSVCAKSCRTGAIKVKDKKFDFNQKKCNYCGRCAKACPANALNGKSIYLLSFGGLFGNRIAQGRQLFPPVNDKNKLFKIFDAALDFFSAHGHPGERFLTTIERDGWDQLESCLKVAAV